MDTQRLTIADAAQLLGVHPNTVRRFVKRALRTDKKAKQFIARDAAGYAIDRAYLLDNLGGNHGQPTSNQTVNQDGDLVALLRDQLRVKDEQIAQLLERDKERNYLLAQAQGVKLLPDGTVAPAEKKRRRWFRRG